jgi:hypothetical protein
VSGLLSRVGNFKECSLNKPLGLRKSQLQGNNSISLSQKGDIFGLSLKSVFGFWQLAMLVPDLGVGNYTGSPTTSCRIRQQNLIGSVREYGNLSAVNINGARIPAQ